MAKIICVDQARHETTPHGTPQFPLEVNHDDLSAFPDGMVRCHWHDELEFSIVQEGSAVYTLGSGVYALSAGQGILMNSRVPHTIVSADGDPAHLLTVIVAPGLISGASGNAIAGELMLPFLQAGSLAAVPLEAEEIALLRAVETADEKRDFAWQLQCKALLCQLFFRLLQRNAQALRGRPVCNGDALDRLNILLDELHAHYPEPLALDRLAKRVHMTRESCCRFFKRMTGQTISQYLQDYRVSQGAKMLRQGQLSVTQIALLVGFSNPGRFSAAFSGRMGCTPRAYARAWAAE